MIRIFFIMAVSSSVFSCNAKEKKNEGGLFVQNDSISNPRMEKLERAFQLTDYKTFFNLFPDTNKEFIDFYGFDENSAEKPLYFKAEFHIPFLFNAPKEYLSCLTEKTVSIALNMKWKADAASYFQEELSNLLMEHPKEILKVLALKTKKEVTSFWYFIFDGSSKYDLQNKEKFDKMYKKIKQLDAKQAEILKQEFNKMYR